MKEQRMIKSLKPVILFRASHGQKEEMEIAGKYFDVFEQRAHIPKGSLVIGRYSVLPYYNELSRDLEHFGSRLINTNREHASIANLSAWYHCFEGITPKTWFHLHEIPEKGPFVLKGETNSRKYSWNTHMYAEDKRVAGEVWSRLSKDGLVEFQNIVIREYVPLRRLDTDATGLPITEEYRLFFYKGKLMSSGFYWASHEHLVEQYDLSTDNIPREFIDQIGGVAYDQVADFVVIDVARTEKGDWIVIELNDGQMSGLSLCDPDELYRNLALQLFA